MRGAAWSVPVISVAATAPAFAASPCDNRPGTVLAWNAANVTHQRESLVRAITKYDPDGAVGTIPELTLTTSVLYSGQMGSGSEFGGQTNDTLQVQNNVGGLSQAGLVMYQSTKATGAGQYADRGAYTFTFSRPVSNLEFTVTDIDSNGNQYRDALELTSGFSVVSKPATLTGAGTSSDPFRPVNDAAPTNDFTGSAGNLRVKYAGPISSFTITYWNQSANLGKKASTFDNQQAVFLGSLTFDYKPC
ncbi:hypothetical protein ASC64_02790 [Nocardioides sp. Root122]|nr:hypothetical protein ASC64_02790 [Nocardioides sp. Root122]